jgi:hypothetical protein
MVKYEVADNDGIVGVGGKVGEVVLMPGAGDGPLSGAGAAIEGVESERVAVERMGEFAGAGTEFEDGLTR